MVKSVDNYLSSTNEWIQQIRKFTVKWNQKKIEKLQSKSVNEIQLVFEDVKDWITKVKLVKSIVLKKHTVFVDLQFLLWLLIELVIAIVNEF